MTAAKQADERRATTTAKRAKERRATTAVKQPESDEL
jgi:hypothetical protein